MTKFQRYLEYRGKTWGKNIKYIKVYISLKATLSAFHCFVFHKNIPNTFEVIALLLKADTIFLNFSVNSCLV